MNYLIAILLTALSLFSLQAYSQDIPFELQREVIRMNNDLTHYRRENKSLTILIKENEQKINQQDSLIKNYSIIVERSDLVNLLLKSDIEKLNTELRKANTRSALFRNVALGAIIAVPLAFILGVSYM